MPEIEEQGERAEPVPRWRRMGRSLSVKLIALLLGAMLVIFSVLGYVNIRQHRRQLEAATLASAERVSDVIKRSTSYYMLHNDRDGLYRTIGTIAGEPGMVRVRIFDQEGKISYSSDAAEVNRMVDKGAEACYGCHAQTQPLARLNRPDRFRIYRANGKGRVLGIITPIENQPSCSNADCHAHPASQQILGVLDTNLSLARADADLAQSTQQMVIYTALAALVIALLSGWFVFRLVHKPVKVLKSGTERLAHGDLGYQLEVRSSDEVGDLANSFNLMSLQLRSANEEITSWARTLEARVDDKSAELKRAHEHVLHVETMASIGKMAAVVAHEVNNPLSGILTYAKLLRKWVTQGGAETRKDEIRECLELIESESRRCGELVKNLLTFSRTSPMNLEWADLNVVTERCVRLVQHQLELNNVQLQLDLAAELPPLHCDPSQIEQVVLALIMNAIDAMPRGGNLLLRTRSLPQSHQVEIQVRDDGAGIAPDVLARLFEPFLTTKETGKGVGLGLAISKGIVERHHGTIEVESKVGRGTTFYIFLPVNANASPEAAVAGTAPAKQSSEVTK